MVLQEEEEVAHYHKIKGEDLSREDHFRKVVKIRGEKVVGKDLDQIKFLISQR